MAYYLVIMWPVTKASKQLEGTTAGVTRFGAGGEGGTVGGEGGQVAITSPLTWQAKSRGILVCTSATLPTISSMRGK